MTEIPPRLTAALVDRYAIERELGQGGMATVYLAEDLKHKRQVAIKVLRPELAAVIGAERFLAEINTTANLQHPHILPLFDSGEADGFLFYVMPFIEGETVRDLLDREKQLPIADAVRIATEVANALDYAHRRNVIHRDIKPENILLHDGSALVADFGIALAATKAGGARMTETGMSLGTPHYMSPEQAMGEREITAKSDIYAVGCVLYEMLTGEAPFTGPTAQAVFAKVMTDEPRPPSQLRKTVPVNVDAAVLTALSKLPADRFATAAAFVQALETPGYAVAATAASAGGGQWRFALIGGLVLGAVGGAAGVVLLKNPAPMKGEVTRDQLTFSGQAHMPAISPNGERVAYIVDPCARGQKDCTVSLEVLEVGGTKAQVLIPAAITLSYPRWSHDGETVVVGGAIDQDRIGIFAIPRLNATPRLIFEGDFGAYDTHAAGDSVLVLAASEDTMYVIDMVDGNIHGRLPAALKQARDISWSPDGTRIAAHDGSGLHVIERDGSARGSVGTSARSWIRWSTAGDALIYFLTDRAREDQLVRRAVTDAGELSDREEVIMPRTPTLYDGQFDIARGTGTIAIRTGDARTDLWSFDFDSSPITSRRETQGTTWYGDPVASFDGKVLYYYRGDALGDNVYRLDRATGTEEALTAERGAGANAMKMSADGSRMGYSRNNGAVRLLQYMELPSRRVFSSTAPVANSVVPVIPDGFLVQNLADGALAFLDSLGGELHLLTDPARLEVWEFAVSADGEHAIFVAFGSISSDAKPGLIVASVPVSGGSVTVLTTLLDAQEDTPGLSVGLDGSIFLGRWLLGEDRPSFWRMAATGGPLTRIGNIPVACEQKSMVVGWNGKTAVCGVDDFRSDIWTVDLGGAIR